MDAPGSHELTDLLVAWSEGDEAALDRLAPLVQAELHRLAKHYMRRERADPLMQTSALINEAHLRLIDWKAVRWQSRAHFFGGLSVEETAEVLKVAPVTVAREWNKAKAWLYRELSRS